MLFQTLVQLNILILATPALAGWSLLPPVHLDTAHAVGIVWHRTVAVAPQSAAPTKARQAAPLPYPVAVPVTQAVTTFTASRPAVTASLSVLPYAARAP